MMDSIKDTKALKEGIFSILEALWFLKLQVVSGLLQIHPIYGNVFDQTAWEIPKNCV